jgi:hypothetical protein
LRITTIFERVPTVLSSWQLAAHGHRQRKHYIDREVLSPRGIEWQMRPSAKP